MKTSYSDDDDVILVVGDRGSRVEPFMVYNYCGDSYIHIGDDLEWNGKNRDNLKFLNGSSRLYMKTML